ncbi:hypothetical protein [Bradyrhizobium roseum]|uniref:hypothetical protein n=1 Tax=Bradyrhizobium roseum TaxID=3056648 RepID=UPI00261117DF|nr:hypothetical protein [Bradyrhizobium roseus]WKA31600.1 hypothetical protein QUH67_16195 [Bradyrhizobium roseus]
MRKLLILLACLLVTSGAEARPRGVAPTNGFNGGGAQINTNTTSYYYNQKRDLNYWQTGAQQKIVSSLNGTLQGKGAWDALGASSQPYFNSTTGELNVPVQSDVTSYCRGVFTDPLGVPGASPTGVYGPPNVGFSGPQGKWWLGQVWNLEWSGTISTAGTKFTNFGSAGTGGSPGFGAVGSCGANCATVTFGNATSASNFEPCFVIDASNRSDPPRNIKFYRSEHVTQARSADLATSMLNPDWLAQWGTAGKNGIGKIRWMDPIGANLNATTDFSQLAEYTFATYGTTDGITGGGTGKVFSSGYNGAAGPKMGIGPQTICVVSNKVGAHAHFTFPYAFTTAAALSLGHAFNGCMNQGLVVEYEYCNEVWNFGGGFNCFRYARRQAWPPLGPSPPYQQAVTVNSITPGNPTTINVTTNTYVNGDVISFSIPGGNTIATALDNDGTNAKGPFIVGNATGASFTVPVDTTGLLYASGGTVFLADGAATRWAGYRSAQLMDQIYAGYGAANRSRWKGVLGGQLESAAQSLQNALTGAMFFISNESVGTGACAPRKCLQELYDKGMVAPYAGNSAYNGTPVQGIQTGTATPTVNASGHSFVNGQVIRCYATTGMTQINNLTGTVSGVGAGVFTLNINTTGFSPWVIGNGNFCIDNALPKAAEDSIALNISTPATYPTKYSYFAEQMSDATINGTSVSNPSFGYTIQSAGNWRSFASCGVSCMPGIFLRNALKAKSYGLTFDEYEGANASEYLDTIGTYVTVSGNSATAQLFDFKANWQYDAGTATKGPADITAAHIAASQAAGAPFPSTYLEIGGGPAPFSATRYAGDANPAITRMYAQNALGPHVESYTPPAWTATYPGNATNKYTASGACTNCTEGPPAHTVLIGTAATTAIVVVAQQSGSVTQVQCDGVSSTTPVIANATSFRVSIFVLSLNAGANARTCQMTTSGAGGAPRTFYVATVAGLLSTTPVSAIASNPNGTFTAGYTGGNLMVAASACGLASGAWANTSGVSTPTAANPVTTTIASDSDNPNKAQFILLWAPFGSPIFSVAPGCNDSSAAATFR